MPTSFRMLPDAFNSASVGTVMLGVTCRKSTVLVLAKIPSAKLGFKESTGARAGSTERSAMSGGPCRVRSPGPLRLSTSAQEG